MDHNPAPPVIDPRALDPEVFRRVWKRVMPDQKDCPIVPAQAPPAKTQRPPAAAPDDARPRSEEELLRHMLNHMRQGYLYAQALSRRTNHSSRGLMRLSADRQAALRQLSTAYFLATGRRFHPTASVPTPPPDLSRALREQYLWEQHWAAQCLSSLQPDQSEMFQQMLRDSARTAGLRAREIRRILEGMSLPY